MPQPLIDALRSELAWAETTNADEERLEAIRDAIAAEEAAAPAGDAADAQPPRELGPEPPAKPTEDPEETLARGHSETLAPKAPAKPKADAKAAPKATAKPKPGDAPRRAGAKAADSE